MFNQTGLELDPAGNGAALVITKVFSRSLASKANIKVGDRIVLINARPRPPGIAMTPLSSSARDRRYTYHPA